MPVIDHSTSIKSTRSHGRSAAHSHQRKVLRQVRVEGAERVPAWVNADRVHVVVRLGAAAESQRCAGERTRFKNARRDARTGLVRRQTASR